MPSINESSENPQRFWIYWAVTVPLTVLVLSIWLTWIWFKMPRIRSAKDSDGSKA